MIRWKCQQCQSTLGAPEWAIGRRIPCPVCTNGIKVPTASDDDPIAPDRPEKPKSATGLCSCIIVVAFAIFVIVVMVLLL